MPKEQQDELREDWRDTSKCYDIAGSVRPIVEEYWINKITEFLNEKAATVEKLKEDIANREGLYLPSTDKSDCANKGYLLGISKAVDIIKGKKE